MSLFISLVEWDSETFGRLRVAASPDHACIEVLEHNEDALGNKTSFWSVLGHDPSVHDTYAQQEHLLLLSAFRALSGSHDEATKADYTLRVGITDVEIGLESCPSHVRTPLLRLFALAIGYSREAISLDDLIGAAKALNAALNTEVVYEQ